MFYLMSFDVCEVDVFMCMLEKFCKLDVCMEWVCVNCGGMVMDFFFEGLVWDLDGYLFVIDILYGCIFCILLLGDWDFVVEYDGEFNGMKCFDVLYLIIIDYWNGLMLFDIE